MNESLTSVMDALSVLESIHDAIGSAVPLSSQAATAPKVSNVEEADEALAHATDQLMQSMTALSRHQQRTLAGQAAGGTAPGEEADEAVREMQGALQAALLTLHATSGVAQSAPELSNARLGVMELMQQLSGVITSGRAGQSLGVQGTGLASGPVGGAEGVMGGSITGPGGGVVQPGLMRRTTNPYGRRMKAVQLTADELWEAFSSKLLAVGLCVAAAKQRRLRIRRGKVKALATCIFMLKLRRRVRMARKIFAVGAMCRAIKLRDEARRRTKLFTMGYATICMTPHRMHHTVCQWR